VRRGSAGESRDIARDVAMPRIDSRRDAGLLTSPVPYAATSARIAAAKASTSASVVSQAVIHRTSPVAGFQS